MTDRATLERALHHATGLVTSLPVGAGDRVATALGNTARTFALQWALALTGVVEVPVPAAASAEEADELLVDARPGLLLVDDATAGPVVAAATARGLAVHRADLDDATPVAPPATAPRTRAMAYTSGTTGRRKGVHVGIHGPDWGERWLGDESAAFDDRHGDRHLVVSPLYHSGPFRHALVTAHRGGSVVVLPSFDVDAWLTALRTHRPTSLFCVPTHLHRLLAHPGLQPDDLASLRLLLHAGAPCPTGLKERVLDVAPDGAVWEFYGSTEGQFTVCPPDEWRAAPGTVGPARRGRALAVLDDDRRPVPTGTTGTVWVTAPSHATWRYWDAPDRTATAWDGDRFTVGDLGHLDVAGRLTLDGRPGDLVVTGGVNVYPAEVERVLLDLDGVGEAAVFGVPDEEWGERLVAAVVPAPGAARPDGPALREAARAHLSPARTPRTVLVVDELPRTPTGKVRRTALPALVTP